MRLARLGPAGFEQPVIEDSTGQVYSLALLTKDIDGDFLANDGIAEAAAALAAGRLEPVRGWQNLRRGSPIAAPTAVVCIGMNYVAHAAESGSAAPTTPLVFLKHPNTVVGPDDTVLIPPEASKVDWEVELAIVIGRRASYLSTPDAARDHMAGFAVSNDISERDFQLRDSGGQWSKGKCCETFNPLGPYLVPTGNGLDPSALHLRSWVNGEPRQDSVTSDMIFDVDYLVWHLSQFMTLEPGDIINTGTPQGVALSGHFPYLQPDDVVELEIEGLGRQRQRLQRVIR